MIPMPTIPSMLFMLLTVLTIALFYWATNKNKAALLIILTVASVQAILSVNGFFLTNPEEPPKFILLVAPSIILIIITFTTRKGKDFILSIDLEKYTYLHTIRIPVEIGLYLLAGYALIPKDMTFEGNNFDIISGLTAPVIAFLGFRKKTLSSTMIVLWNITCLVLLLNVVIPAILSVPSEIQQFNFAQPNIAVTYFPFIWLPGIIVPTVIFGHFVLLFRRKELE